MSFEFRRYIPRGSVVFRHNGFVLHRCSAVKHFVRMDAPSRGQMGKFFSLSKERQSANASGAVGHYFGTFIRSVYFAVLGLFSHAQRSCRITYAKHVNNG